MYFTTEFFTMLSVFKFIFLFTSVANAIEYYGATPSVDQYNALEELNALLNLDDISIVSILRTSDLYGSDAASHFAHLGIENGTIDSILPSYTDNSVHSIETRDSIDSSCKNGQKVYLSQETTSQVCNALAAIVSGGIASVSVVFTAKSCTVTSTGLGGNQPGSLKCNAGWAFFGGSTAPLSYYEITTYCPSLLNKIKTSCKGGSGDANEDNHRLVQYVTQSDLTCGDETTGACTQINN